METIGMLTIAKLFAAWGPIGLVVLIWYVDQKVIRTNQSEHKKEIYCVLDRYKEDMAEMRRMYEKNVSLVKDYNGLASELKDMIVMNTQAMTRLVDRINGSKK